METVTKSDIIATTAKKADMTQKEAGEVVNAFLNTVTEQLAEGKKVALAGFGTFEVRKRADREGRNPQTGAKMYIKGTKTIGFKSLKGLKEAVNK